LGRSGVERTGRLSLGQSGCALQNTLLAGFTLLRDLGTEGAGFSDLAIKRAIEEGIIPGRDCWL